MKKESSLNLLLISILSLVLGIVLIAATDDILTIFNYIFVCIFGIIGVIEIITFFVGRGYKEDDYSSLIMAIVFLWLALIMYVYYMMIINILPIIFSLYLFIMGALMIIRYFKERNSKKTCLQYLIIGIISIIVGILLIFKPKFGIYTYLKITGINIVLIAILFFFDFIQSCRKKND